MLPLAGSPNLVIVGREVQLGSGYADLVAIEPSGRLVIIEVKLAKNAEARRAIVTQTLAYAAYLHGEDSDHVESGILKTHLQERGYESLAGAVSSGAQAGFDEAPFREGLEDGLASGRFRLVFVLDEAPAELVRLVRYLEAVAGELIIDLVTVAAYQVNGAQVLVPQRVEPGRAEVETATSKKKPATADAGYYSWGSEEFEASIESATEENQPRLRRLLEWAKELEAARFCRLGSYRGRGGRVTLLPYLMDVQSGLITIWNDTGSAYLSFWRSVFEKRAPHRIEAIESLITPAVIGQGTTSHNITDELLSLLRRAYEDAATPADVVVVAARKAYPEYFKYHAYVCQTGRSFREGLTRLGFYADQTVKPEFPGILARRDRLEFTEQQVEDLRTTGDPADEAFADVIESMLRDETERRGRLEQIFLLTPPDSPATMTLGGPVTHSGSAWVQQQRYIRSEMLTSNPKTTADLTQAQA